MSKLAVADLWTLAEYAEQRSEFRKKVIAHKKNRTLRLGPAVTLLFEDRLLVRYQLQELLRLERIADPAAIQDELDAYNPLIPDGGNWKATCLVDFGGAKEPADLDGIAHGIWVQVGQLPRVTAIADEDLDRAGAGGPAAVHFLRFELPPGCARAIGGGAALRVGVDHPGYSHAIAASPATRQSLLADLR